MYNPALMKTKAFDLVIFDCDGVLVDSEPLANEVYTQMLSEFGYKVDTNEYLSQFWGAAMTNRLEATSKNLNWTPPKNFLPMFYKRLAERITNELKPVSGVRELIQSLAVPYCLASNGSRDEIMLRIKVAQLEDLFMGKKIFSGMEMPHPKPAPDVYLAAANAFNVSPERCVVIEDSIPGVTAGIRAGMKVYGRAVFTSHETLQQARAIPFDKMSELQELLG